MSDTSVDALVIGGGFYGCAVAEWFRGLGGSVLLAESQPTLFSRASFVNQARIHNGYHYPRSLATAYRSRVNFPRFVEKYPGCVVRNFRKLYAIGATRSRVSASQFARFCDLIGAPCQRAAPILRRMFNPALVQDVFEVEEYAFDSSVLRRLFATRLAQAGVDVRCDTQVRQVVTSASGEHQASLSSGLPVRCRYIFNCTYSGLLHVPGLAEHCGALLKHEIAEMAMITPPPELDGIGITIMDGPFFSTMPFPALGLYSLSHVRYTPHASWQDAPGLDAPEVILERYAKHPRALAMIKDAQRYLPPMAKAQYRHSLFTTKTILVRNESDDGRPILMERSGPGGTVVTLMGGKIDNIFDCLQALETTIQ